MSDLSFDYNVLYQPSGAALFAIAEPDLTQLGLKRNGFRKEHHLAVFNAFRFSMLNAGANGILAQAFYHTVPFQVGDILEITVDTRHVDAAKITNDNLKKLQDMLCPQDVDVFAAASGSKTVVDKIAAIRAALPAATGSLATTLNLTTIHTTADADILLKMGLIDADMAIGNAEIEVSADAIRDLSFATWSVFLYSHSPLPVLMSSALKTIEFCKLLNESGVTESLMEHELIAGIYGIEKSKAVVATVKIDADFRDCVLSHGHFDRVALVASNDRAGVRTNINIAANALPLMREFCFYITQLHHANMNNIDRNHEFAAARTIVVRHGLHLDSEEVGHFADLNIGIEPVNSFERYIAFAAKPEVAYACMFVSALSFIKSGHHASSANIDNLLSKVLGAIGHPTQLDVCAQMVRGAVYHGPHVASMRMLIGFIYVKNASGKVSSSIMNRMHVTPPLAVGLVNLELFLDALSRAKFFTMMKREKDFNDFKDNMRLIRSVMHFCTSYSNYLYGKSVAEPETAKMEASKMAVYATALQTIMPNSSLLKSASLRKMITDAANSVIMESVQVESFILAYRKFYSTMMTNYLEVQVNNKQLLLA